MDFDPSAFLSMAMTEDQDAVYTAPDVPQGFSPVKMPPGEIVVEGGLQMEQGVQIPVPMFGLLHSGESEEAEEVNEVDPFSTPLQVDTSIPESQTTPQPSPGERTSSPCSKRVIQTSLEETRFRKEVFAGHYERVKIFRLHCSICDRHLGCAPWFTERQMRMHKLLNVVVCRTCFEFYGDINFPVEDGSEMFCCWCGEGGECFCCSTCPKIVCKKCVMQNFGADKVKEIDKNDDWSCFVCQPEDIWPHRALMWGLQRWCKGNRQLVAMLPKEERQAKLSKDTSHCCLKVKIEISYVSLPAKNTLSRIPQSMIAFPYQARVKEALARPSNMIPPNNLMTYAPTQIIPPVNNHYQTPRAVVSQHQMPRAVVSQHQMPRAVVSQQQIPRTVVSQQQMPRTVVSQQQIPRTVVGFNARHMVHRNTVMNRPIPYPMNRMPSMIQPPPPPLRHFQYPPRQPTYQPTPPPQSSTTSGQIPEQNLLHSKTPLIDVSPLENGVREIKSFLQPTLTMLDQFYVVKNELANDFEKLTSFSDKLSYNIKIAICNLAKANTDLIESQRKIIDSKVSSVVNNIRTVVNAATPIVNGTADSININLNNSNTKGSDPPKTIDSSPEIIDISSYSPSRTPENNLSNLEQTTPATPASSTAEEGEDLAIAMLCETVLEEGDNKENKDDANKDQATPARGQQQTVNKPVTGKSRRRINRKRLLNQNDSSEVQVIDLVNDEDEKKKYDESHWLKKFKIVPCKIVLQRVKSP